MSHTTCPTVETLSAFALGELPEPELSAVAEHLDCCVECAEQAARFDRVTDPFVSELKRVPSLAPTPNARQRRWSAKARRPSRTAATSTSCNTLHGAGSTRSRRPARHLVRREAARLILDRDMPANAFAP